ncbi:MAG TPA: ketose-bisphosphate aldolase [Kosmotogaceae bacterium]|nr:ketose-bisphosphate aldolase [Kosmotogaceae bacterium]
MALVTLAEVLNDAYRNGYAVAGFNFYTYEDASAIVRGAEELDSPVILMASGKAIKHLGVDYAASTVKVLAERASVPVVAHLDHATDLKTIFQAIKHGFTSVMYDGSMLGIDENIKNTKLVVSVARALGVSVEAEIGRVGMSEEGEDIGEILTDPDSASEFYDSTGVDALAVAIGSAHGMQKQEASLDLDLAREIHESVDVPLVLHGSSGVRDEDLRQIARYGFAKINIGTKLKHVFAQGIRDLCNSSTYVPDPLKIVVNASQEISHVVKEKIALLRE